MVYTNSRPIELCYTSIDGIQNKLGNVNYVIFKPEVAGYYKVKVNTGQNQDHDLSIIKSGNEIAVYNNSNNENTYLSTLMSAEKHIIKVSVWDPDEYITRGNYCFDLQVTTN